MCRDSECGNLTKFPSTEEQETATAICTRRVVSNEQQNMILSSLVSYHKLLLKELIQKAGHINLTTSNIKFLLGFSELQIDQVLKNCDKLFSIDDVVNYVEMWDIKHAHKIMNIIAQAFGDISNVQLGDIPEDSADSDDDYLDIHGEWDNLLDDNDLLDLAVDNLSASLLDTSINYSHDNSMDTDIPTVVICALDHLTISSVDD